MLLVYDSLVAQGVIDITKDPGIQLSSSLQQTEMLNVQGIFQQLFTDVEPALIIHDLLFVRHIHTACIYTISVFSFVHA